MIGDWEDRECESREWWRVSEGIIGHFPGKVGGGSLLASSVGGGER